MNSSSSSDSIVAAVALSNPGAATIQGETQDSFDSAATNTKVAFDATSVDYQASSPPVNIGSATQGAGAGKAQAQTITVTKVMDSISPTLLAATSSRQVFRQGLIVIPGGGSSQNGAGAGKGDDLRLELSDVYITGDHISTSAGSKPTETLTLEVLGVKIADVSSQNVDGGVTQQLPTGWNRVLNTADQTTAGITSVHRK